MWDFSAGCYPLRILVRCTWHSGMPNTAGERTGLAHGGRDSISKANIAMVGAQRGWRGWWSVRACCA